MGKFSLKKSDGDEDSSRLALFGSRSKARSPAPPSQNPYAQPTVAPDPYTQAKMNAGILPAQGPPPQGRGAPQAPGGYGGLGQPAPGGYGRDNRYGGPQNGYGGENKPGGPSPGAYSQDQKFGAPGGGRGAAGFAPNQYAGQNGYGGNKGGENPYAAISQTSGTARYGAGGYGGLGRTNSSETTTTDMNRDALFGEARERAQERQQTGAPPYEYNAGQPEGEARNYGAYGDRQLTAEEEEEEDITATKQEIKFMKHQDVASTRNALQMAAAAEESGRNTLARLGDQGERIHNTEKNLDLAANHNLSAEDKYKELKTLNRSMFAVHMNNPFTGKERRGKRDEQIYERHRTERDQREATREAAFQSNARMNDNFKGVDQVSSANKPKGSLADRAKYQFEADSDDDQLENEIESNIDALSGAAGRLNILARATGAEVEAQNKHLERIGVKVSLCQCLFQSSMRSALLIW